MLNILVNVVMIIVGVFLVLGILAVRGTFYIWLFFLSVFTLTLQLTDNIEIIGSILLWVAILIGLIFSQKNIRQQLVSQNILKYFKKKLPDVGNIEKAMVVSGHKWFEGNILNGNLNWDLLLQWPNPELTAREQIFLGNQVDTLCGMLNDWDLTQSKSDLSPQIWVYLKQHKFLSMLIPQEYGGLGFSSFAISEIVQKIATRSVTAAINIMVPNSLGPHELLLKYGTKLQKEEYLPQLAAGYHVPAFAVTSDVEDSDPALMSDNGIVCYGKYQDQEVLGILLNWDKSYVTLAPIATLLCLVVKLYDPNNLLVGSHKELGFTVCLIPTNLPGITHNTKYLPLNQVCMSGPIRGKNVFLPFDFIVGGKDMIGHGSLMFNSCLSTFRGISLSALGSAIGKVGFKNITTYSVIRKKFGLPMEEFDGVEENLAKIGGYTYMLESIRNLTLTAFNMGYNSGIITAMAKCSITELSRKIINAAMDVSGSRATMLGANNYLARLYQSIPISIAMDGSNNLLKNTMIFQVGSIKCHPFLTAELEAVDTNNVKMFDQHFLAHISYALSNFAKMVLHSCSNKIFCLGFKHQLINKHFKKYCKNLSFFSIVLSCLVELSFLKYGVSLKQNERLSSRLVDVWSYIYMGCAVVKYHSKNTIDSDDVVFATWCLQKCLHEIQQSIIKVLQNFSNKFLAKILAFIIFPFGKNYEAPNDISEHSISNIMIKNTAIRTRLLSGSYIASDDRWEVAFKKMLNIAVLSKKIDLAEKSGVIPKNIDLDLTINMAVQEKILTELEANLIKEAELAVNDAMKVDEFSVNNL